MKKILVIINGVTGAIGSACLARFSRQSDVTIVGLSRKAPRLEVLARSGTLPDCHCVCSIGETNAANCATFVGTIDVDRYERIVYVHAVGVYPFELNDRGEIEVAHDHDGDGIDDRVLELSHHAFFAMTEALTSKGLPVSALLFGGIADRHRPLVHQSWWRVMEKTKARMRMARSRVLSFAVLNISSVVCPHELMTRPFVFSHTNADARYWLLPDEVAVEVLRLALVGIEGVHETDLFHPAPYCTPEYFLDKPFTERKKAELGLAQEYG